MQTSFPFLSACKPPKRAPDDMLARITSEAQAVKVSIGSSRLKQAYIAAELKVSPSYLSLIRNGKRPVPEHLVQPFCYLVGSLLLQQYREFRAALRAVRGQGADDLDARLANELREAA
jgi:hypothetical protein